MHLNLGLQLPCWHGISACAAHLQHLPICQGEASIGCCWKHTSAAASLLDCVPPTHHVLAAHALQRVQFKQVFPDASANAIDLLARMLQFDPRKRITVEEALQHPYLAQLHDPAAEPAAPREDLQAPA